MVWNFNNLQEFIDFLDQKGEIVRIFEPVSSELEITEITNRVILNQGPALIFENVQGTNIPVVINLFGTHQRVAWALGVELIDDQTNRIRAILDMAQSPPKGLMGKLSSLFDLAAVARTQPKLVKNAPVQEVVLEGNDARLDFLPAIKCWPMDAGKYITLPLVISKDPITSKRNVGIYRMQIFDGKTAGMHWQTHKGGFHHELSGKRSGLDKLEVAVALGGDPATVWSGSLPLPPGMDEFVAAGFLRGKSVNLAKCKTVDLEVPAEAEIILEGYIVPGETKKEGPFGDHTGYYSMPEDYPVFHLTAITHRRQPLYLTTFVGRPPKEDFFMGKASERIMLPALQMVLPEIVDINMPAEGVFHNLVIVSIRKDYPGHVSKVLHGLWGLGLLMLSKTIIIVDHFVNIQNLSEVAWRVTNNIDPKRDIMFSEGPIDDLDHASSSPRVGSKVGIDATIKNRSDGFERDWPPDIVMTDEVKRVIDSKWESFGF